MNTCSETRDFIPLFPDDLEASEASLVREHVASCTACAAELGVFAAQAAVWRRVRSGRERANLYAGIEAKLRAKPVVVAFPRRPIYAAAAAAVVVGFGLLALMRSGEAPRPTDPRPDNLVAKGTNKVEAPAPSQAPRRDHDVARGESRRGRGHRNFFDTESATPYRLADSVELVPLDEEASVPEAPSRTFVAPPAAHPAPKGGDEDRSLSF